jgi:hypothetical protein
MGRAQLIPNGTEVTLRTTCLTVAESPWRRHEDIRAPPCPTQSSYQRKVSRSRRH